MPAWNGPPLLSAFQAKPILDAMKAGERSIQTSLDLGLSQVECEIASPEGPLTCMTPAGSLSLQRKELLEIAKEDRKVFRLDTSPIEAIKVFSEETGWVRSLCPTVTAPTVLVSGVPMHRIKDTNPVLDTRAKLRALGAPKGRVLDTATGLGYTAIEAAKSALSVVTVELDPGASEIARLNPWSAALFDNPKIEQRIGDIVEVIREFPVGSFGAVIHDPPTLALGGDLYGAAFYAELGRVLQRGGRLFHYIGDPTSGLGAKTYPGVIRRLDEAGFRRIVRHPDAFGVTAVAG